MKCLNNHKQFDVFLRKIIFKISILSKKNSLPGKVSAITSMCSSAEAQ